LPRRKEIGPEEEDDVEILDRIVIPIPGTDVEENECRRETEDAEGFKVTHRWTDRLGTGISYKPPRLRCSGCTHISGDVIKKDTGEFQFIHGFMGWFLSKGKSVVNRVSLLRDTFTRNWTRLTHTLNVIPPKPNLRAEREWFRQEPMDDPELEIIGLRKEHLLRALGFRYPHRAMFHGRINVRHIANLKSFVHAFIQKRSKCPGSREVDAEYAKAASSADVNQAYRYGYLKSWREGLRKEGHIIFEGMFHNTEEDHENMYGGEQFKNIFIRSTKSLFNYFDKLVPRVIGESTEVDLPEHKHIWDIIRDTAELGDGELRVDSRLASKCEATNENLEDNNQGLLAVRCSLEIVFMIICCMLNLRQAHIDTDDSHRTKEIYAPDTGSRFLASMPLARPQIPHTDYYLNAALFSHLLPAERVRKHVKNLKKLYTRWKNAISKDGAFQELFRDAVRPALFEKVLAGITSNEYVEMNEGKQTNERTGRKKLALPPYFIIFAGKQGASLHTIPGSDRWVFEDDKKFDKRMADANTETLKVEIPPWSICIFKGDIAHGGAKGKNNKNFLRIHMYVMREGIITPDGINHRHLRNAWGNYEGESEEELDTSEDENSDDPLYDAAMDVDNVDEGATRNSMNQLVEEESDDDDDDDDDEDEEDEEEEEVQEGNGEATSMEIDN